MPDRASPDTLIDHPLVHFGREVCGDPTASMRREWLVTNGLGGYASGTVAGVNTRRYHGLLVAALEPPVARTVLLGGMVEWATIHGVRYPLATHEYAGGTLEPQGHLHLQSFRLEGTLPVWEYAIGDTVLERRVWMVFGANTTYVSYRVLRASGAVDLEITPLVTYRDFHALTSGQGWQPGVDTVPSGVKVSAFSGARPFWLLSDGATFDRDGTWYWNFHHREEQARGLDDRSDLFAPGQFRARLGEGEGVAILCSSEDQAAIDAGRTLAAERERQDRLLRQAGVERDAAAIQQLVLAADQFVVERSIPEGGAAPHGRKTVIAGYHWFNDWGRDTMIALPGLTLATGRPGDAADILRTFALYVRDGLLPNNFPDRAGNIPGYNTVDATLWYVLAIHAYREATRDEALVDDLLPVLREIVAWHLRGTRYTIGVDPDDGLLRAGEPGVQLTWMDAKVGDWVVTPRIGKPVEINALWYNVLSIMAGFLADRGSPEAEHYREMAGKTHASFRARFIQSGHEHLADVVDTPQGDDFTLRPNRIFALSLPFPLLEGAEAAPILQAVGRTLLTSYGLRSLSPDDPAYRGDYGGDAFRRDSGYHQGPAWSWLLGAYAEASYRLTGDAERALAWLRPLENHLTDAGLGSISELFEGNAPYLPRGCVAQAWGVAETLRVWRLLSREQANA